MLRHYYISNDLDDLEVIENELTSKGITKPQIHVLSENDAEIERHHLHAIESVLKKDVVFSTQVGAVIGVLAASLVLAVVYLLQWHTHPAGWTPWIFLAITTLGFCTWEGGLIGIQLPHRQFKRFQKTLQAGYHVFFVDVDADQEAALSEVVNQHPRLKLAGTGEATPAWVVRGQDRFHSFIKSMP